MDRGRAASRDRLKPLEVMVIDAGGDYVALLRKEGAALLRTEVAHGKAWGSLALGMESRQLDLRAGQNPRYFTAFGSWVLLMSAIMPIATKSSRSRPCETSALPPRSRRYPADPPTAAPAETKALRRTLRTLKALTMRTACKRAMPTQTWLGSCRSIITPNAIGATAWPMSIPE